MSSFPKAFTVTPYCVYYRFDSYERKRAKRLLSYLSFRSWQSCRVAIKIILFRSNMFSIKL